MICFMFYVEQVTHLASLGHWLLPAVDVQLRSGDAFGNGQVSYSTVWPK